MNQRDIPVPFTFVTAKSSLNNLMLKVAVLGQLLCSMENVDHLLVVLVWAIPKLTTAGGMSERSTLLPSKL